jgi:hypothetical protein
MVAGAISSPDFGCTDSGCDWVYANNNSPVTHVIQGLVPNIMVAILVIVASIFLRGLARWEGIPQKTGVELSLMNRFFLFQIIVRAL